MPRDSEGAIFWLTAASAAASLVSIAAMEILMAAAIVLWVLTRPVPVRWPSYLLPLLALLIITVISLALSPNPGGGRHAIQKTVLVSMGVLAASFVTTEARARNAYKLLLAVTAVSAIVALVQFAIAEVTFLKTGLLADDPTLINRITGPLGHWMTFSGVQLLVWCAAVPATVFLGRKWIAAVILSGIAIVLSNTRGVWLGAAAGFAFVAWALPKRLIVIAIVSLLIVGAAASPIIYRRISMSLDPTLSTNYSRKAYWSAGTKMIEEHPLLGVGPERIGEEFPKYYTGPTVDYFGHLHNNFLQIAAERGLLGFAAFVWFLAEVYRSLLSRLRESEEDTWWITLGSLAALTGFVVAGMTEYNFGDSEVLVLLLFLVSVPIGLTAHVQKDPDSEPG
jgi:O-antigen ligase